ncbi:MAG: thermonuclease family protein [Myxococcales bacterium]
MRCPDLARELVQQGLAMVFAVDAAASKDLLSAQAQAQKKKAGMWKKGVPPRLISSAHSVLEGKGYNRIVDTKTGQATAEEHAEAFETCDQICTSEGRDASCLMFVPFKRRYTDPPACLTDPRLAPRPPRVVSGYPPP